MSHDFEPTAAEKEMLGMVNQIDVNAVNARTREGAVKKNKVVAIGDVHGRTLWKDIVAKEADADRIVFIGDFFDSFNIPGAEQLENFVDILKFKDEHPEKVVLIWGNHDFHYSQFCGHDRYSGYNDAIAPYFKDMMNILHPQMKIAHIEDGVLYSHAGVTNTWLFNHGLTVNTIHEAPMESLRYQREDTSGYGNHKAQSPIWVRPEALIPDANQDYIQVAGHTRQENISYYEGEHPTRLILIDCHDSVPEYLVVKDGVPETAKLF